MAAGVYMIENTVNGKRYIGSSVDICFRIYKHRWGLRRGKHQNKHLQLAWNSAGESVFEFSVLQLVSDRTELQTAEQLHIDMHRSADNAFGYNLIPFADTKSGYRHTGEAKRKIAETSSGRTKTPEQREAAREWMKGNRNAVGVIFTEERRKKISLALTGKKLSAEHCESIRLSLTGRRLSQETKEKIRIGNKGKVRSEEIKNNMSNARKGWVLSEEWRDKISKTLTGRIQSDCTRNKRSDSMKAYWKSRRAA